MSLLSASGLSMCSRKETKWQARYLKRNHKFGTELPNTMEQALALDIKNGNTLWADVISKEMENVRVAFEILSDGKSTPIGH